MEDRAPFDAKVLRRIGVGSGIVCCEVAEGLLDVTEAELRHVSIVLTPRISTSGTWDPSRKPIRYRRGKSRPTLDFVKRLPLLALLSGCGQETVPFEIPEPPPIGFQIHLKPVTIAPGEDIEFCTYFNLDTPEALAADGKPFLLQDLIVNQIDAGADEIAVNRIDVRGAPGLHHIQILAIENDLEDVEDKHIFECAVDLFGGPLTGDVEPLFFTSRSDLAVTYPDGAARILKRVPDLADDTQTRGAQLLYNFHYLNPTLEPIAAEVVV